MRTKLSCQCCGISFYPQNGSLKQKYCSRKCLGKAQIGNKRGQGYRHSEDAKKKISDICKGKKPYNITEEIKLKISKSLKGNIPWNKGLKNWRKDYSHTTETRIKMSNSSKGEKSYRWKGGITKANQSLRHSVYANLWRESVFKRDAFTCRICGAKSKIGQRIILNAHHIKQWAEYPELRFDLNNGITLCKDCHYILHYGKIDYTGNDPIREDGAKFSELKNSLKTKSPARGDS